MSILLKTRIPRRSVLRGMLGAGAVSVALPFLDCFLNDNGTALASGRPLPVRFGTWFWGLGHSRNSGVSAKTSSIELLQETKPLERHLKHMNYLDGFNAPVDGRANFTHYSGLILASTGSAPTSDQDIPAPTLDVLVSDAIGTGTRFRVLNLTASGSARDSYSARTSGNRNAAESSPLDFYARIFGSEFIDPNKAEFSPDPKIMVRQSVLSSVNDDSKRFVSTLGSSDRARMDAYFTAIRELEQQLALQLQKPPPNEACKVPDIERGEFDVGSTEIAQVVRKNKAMAQILAMAVACNQTKVFTMTFNVAASTLRRLGMGATHHNLSHEEPLDAKLGYQVSVSSFNRMIMEGCADFIDAFASIKEGDGTLLDNTLIFAHSDTNDARVHALESIPVIMFGSAGGRLKSGIRVVGNGDPISRVGLTAMQAVGVPIQSWGTRSNETSKPVSELFA
jgi:hypothetical protein